MLRLSRAAKNPVLKFYNMKCALVTGGSRGIGRAICIKLATQGYHILVNFRSNVAEAEQTLASIHENEGSGELLPFDVSDKMQIDSALTTWLEIHKEDTL